MKLGILAVAVGIAVFSFGGPPRSAPDERTERFDKDPGWEGRNNRTTAFEAKTIKQDFGYSAATHTLGGIINPAAEPAYYAKKIPNKTFNDVLTASGTVVCKGPAFHAVIGFFNSGTINEWRTPNAISIRLSARGSYFLAWLEYATHRWRAGGDNPQGFQNRDPVSGKPTMHEFPGGDTVYKWTLKYDPEGNNGLGVVTATLNGRTAICNLDPGHKAEGATFNRFGVMNLMKHWDNGGRIDVDDITVNGETETFDKDPGWEGFQNRREYVSTSVRPRFDFGYSPTNFAGGQGKGELGGLGFRGDCRYSERMACYGDRLGLLSLDRPLRASGKIVLKRAVSDSTVLLGFYHSQDSMLIHNSQATGIPRNFMGIAVEGPSSVGFYVYPIYGVNAEDNSGRGNAYGEQCPRIYPDGVTHNWSLDYDPDAAEGKGRITVTMDGKVVPLDLKAGEKATGARFDRFGIISTWIDGNGQNIYFDDLTYTCK